VIAQAVVRQSDGRLAIRMTEELVQLQAETPNFWFIAEDDERRSVSMGHVPTVYASFGGKLSELSFGEIRGRIAPHELTAVLRREVGPAGVLTVLAHGRLTELSFLVLLASSIGVLPIILVLVLVSGTTTPWVVRRSLAGVWRIAREAEQIDASRRGRRLTEDHVPEEIAPLVRAVNDALRRLDDGYERQRRFIASAAHELRTPIAILRVKVDAAREMETRRLGLDVERLQLLAEQLLDLQRMDTEHSDEDVDLGSLARRVAGDLAPLLIASGRTIEVSVEEPLSVRGDPAAIGRVLTNLVHNAMEHGGLHVVLRVFGSVIEVEDDGPGIPEEERERVFEPFHRLRPRSTGTGLGLHLVQQVVERHDGRVSVLSAPNNGTIVRVELVAD
jgi:signal transduction histidine kinase